jgi:hypothetical protein
MVEYFYVGKCNYVRNGGLRPPLFANIYNRVITHLESWDDMVSPTTIQEAVQFIRLQVKYII